MTPYFWREMSALIQNFTCDITTLPWQRSVPKWHKKKKDNFKQQGGFLPGGGTWVFFGWVCAARDFKLAPRSKKNFS